MKNHFHLHLKRLKFDWFCNFRMKNYLIFSPFFTSNKIICTLES